MEPHLTPANVEGLKSYKYSSTNTPTSLLEEATKAQTGSVWGLAYNKSKKEVYSATFLKRHVGVKGNLGDIYVTTIGGTSDATLFTTIPNAGSIPSDAARGLGTPTSTSRDSLAFGLIGRVGLGDIDLSEDDNTLFVVNLNDKQLYLVSVATQNVITSIPIPSICNASNGEMIPFGLKVYRGKVYVGTVCNAMISRNRNDMQANVFEFDITTNTFNTTPVLSFPLNYTKGQAYLAAGLTGVAGENLGVHSSKWYPWLDVFDAIEMNAYYLSGVPMYQVAHPTPILSDIEIDNNGNMIIGLMDRGSQQFGEVNILPHANIQEAIYAGGDILKANLVASNSWTIESTITTGGEFFVGDIFNVGYTHEEVTNGGLCYSINNNVVISNCYDPTVNVNSGGVLFFNNSNGTKTKGVELYQGNLPYFGKAAGLSDIEMVCDAAPIQIGNYVWQDTDNDGVQDANENPLANITVSLWKGGSQIASTTTNAKGEYYFSSKSVLGASWTGTGADTTLLPLTAYEVKVNMSSLTNYVLTGLNSSDDQSDNDAALVGNYATIALNTGNAGSINHTLDFGFSCVPTPITSVVYTPATCSYITPNSNASIKLFTTGDKVAISTTGVPSTTYASATAVASGSVTFSSQNGAVDSFYVREWNGSVCFKDTVVVVEPVHCCPAFTLVNDPTNILLCTEGTMSFYNTITTAHAPDSIRLVYFWSKQTSGDSIYHYGTTMAQKPITSANATNVVNFSNIPVPANNGIDPVNLYVYALIIRTPEDTFCRVYEESIFTLYPKPVQTITGYSFICNGDVLNLTTQKATTYAWGKVGSSPFSGAQNAQDYATSASTTKKYYLYTTNVAGCRSDSAFLNVTSSAGIVGFAYNDLNGNGIKEASENVGVAGVKVYAFSGAGAILDSTITDSNGQYSFPNILAAAGKVKIEFVKSTIPAPFNSSLNGTGNGTDVQFVTAPSCATNLGLMDTTNYCGNARLVSPVYPNGAIGSTSTLYSFQYDYLPNQTFLATTAQIGSTWGVAHNKKDKLLYSAAFLKRFVGLGASGLGAIYQTSTATATQNGALFFDLATVDNVGNSLINISSRNLTVDTPAVRLIGKVGLGGIETSTDNNFVYTISLASKKLWQIPTGNPTASNVTSWTIPNLPNWNLAKGDYRPFALKYYNNKLYIGVTFDAELSQDSLDLSAAVYEFDPSTGVFAQILTVPMNYAKGGLGGTVTSPAAWRAWKTNIVQMGSYINYATPMLSDIDFDTDGTMMLSFFDRTGHQFGVAAAGYNGTGTISTLIGGEIVRVGRNPNNLSEYQFESNGRFYNNQGQLIVSDWGIANGQGNGGGEFYQDDAYNLIHQEAPLGGVAVIPGSNVISFTAMDAGNQIWVSGINQNSQITGIRTATVSAVPSFQGKANGMGDLELICDIAPLQIGNYVWLDTDQDGVQDANENPIANITVSLWKNGTQIASTTTNAKGEYYFSKKSVLGALWTGTGADTILLPLTAYEVKIQKDNQAAISSLYVTSTNSTLNKGDDQTDNDAVLNGNFAVISLTTGLAGSINHTYDFGFSTCARPTFSFSLAYPTCTNSIPNNDGTISLTAYTNANKYGVSSGSTYTGPAYAAASNLGAMPQILQGSIPNAGGTYTFRIFNGTETCFLDTTIQVIGSTLELSGRDTTICLGNTLNLASLFTQDTLVGAISYHVSYSNAQDSTNAIGSSVVAQTATTPYFVRKSLSNGCFAIDTLGVTVLSTSVSIADTMVCGNTTALLDAGTHTAYLWSTGETSQTISKPAGVYTITVTDAGGCTATDSVTVVQGVLDTVIICNDGVDSFRLTAPSGLVNVQWFTADSTFVGTYDTLVVTSNTLGLADGTETYHFNAFNATGCPVNSCCPVVVNTISCVYSLGNRIFIDTDNSGAMNGAELGIDGVQVRLLNANGTTYDSDTSTAGVQALTLTTAGGGYYRFDGLPAGDYMVEVVAANFAVGAPLYAYTSSTGAAQEATPNADNDLNDNGLDAPVAGAIRSGVVSLSGTEPTTDTDEPSSYAAGSFSGTVAPNANNNFTVDFGFLCIPPSVVARDTAICLGNSVNLANMFTQDTIAGTIKYYNTLADALAQSPELTPSTVTPTATQTYMIRKNTVGTCFAIDSVLVTINSAPTVTINDAEICSGTSATITATTAETNIVWSTTETTASITVMPNANTTYAVTVTNAAGCTATDSGVVSVVSQPQAGNDQSLACALQVMQTTANLGISGNWSVVSQPAGANAAVTGAGAVSNMLIAGDYVFRLTNTGTTITCTDDVKITVVACPTCPQRVCIPVTVVRN